MSSITKFQIERTEADFSQDDAASKRTSRYFLIAVALLAIIGIPVLLLTTSVYVLFALIILILFAYGINSLQSRGLGFDIKPIVIDEKGIRTEGAVKKTPLVHPAIIRYDEIDSIRILEERVNLANPSMPPRKEMLVETKDGVTYRFKAWDGKMIDQAVNNIIRNAGGGLAAEYPKQPVRAETYFNNDLDRKFALAVFLFFLGLALLIPGVLAAKFLISANPGNVEGWAVALILGIFFISLDLNFAWTSEVLQPHELIIGTGGLGFRRRLFGSKLIPYSTVIGLQYPDPDLFDRRISHMVVAKSGRPLLVTAEIASAINDAVREANGIEPTRFIPCKGNYRNLRR